MNKTMQKLLVMMLLVMMGISSISCGSPSEGMSAPAVASSSMETSAGTESVSATKDDYQKAVSDYADLVSELRSNLKEAEALLQNVTPSMVMDEETWKTLEELWRKLVLQDAAGGLEASVSDMENSEADIQRQIQGIEEQIDELRGYNESLLLYMSEVEESKRLFEESNKSEIIMVCFNAVIGQNNISVYSVNPENGEQTMISSFKGYYSVTAHKDGRKWTNLISNIGLSPRAPLRGMFSKDYKYMAYTRFAQDTGEWHAGYYDEELRFYDATEGFDMVGGDFDEPVNQIAIGFAEDGHFIFAELPKISGWFVGYQTYDQNWTAYQAALAESGGMVKNSLKPYDNLDMLQGDNWEWLEENCEVTDWIDESHCIVNYPEKDADLMFGGTRIDRWGVRVFDTQTGEYSSIIPGDTRTNWSGVISPDGKNAAFLSAPLSGNGNAALYYVPIEGGEPVKIADNISISRTVSSNVISRPCNSGSASSSSNINFVFLVEWRKTRH